MTRSNQVSIAALVDAQFSHAPFVKQGHNGLIFHGAAHSVGVNDAAKLRGSGLIFFEQGRARKADVTGMGKDAAHLGMNGAVLRAVTFVHQHKNIGIGVDHLLFGNRLEFIDDRGDQVCLSSLDELDQFLARSWLLPPFCRSR